MTRRLLLVHAHPDDESILTGGVIARYLAEGVDVCVVTCTLGEEGEVIGQQWAGLVADGGADQLGGYRIGELTAALAALTPPGSAPLQPYFLGGAGRWRDSGMAGTPSAEHPRAFVKAGEGATEALAAVLDEFRPDVVVGYDPDGGYGHPDHIAVHHVTHAAVDAASHRVAKLYWAAGLRSAVDAGLEALGDVPASWQVPAAGELPALASVTTAVDVSGVLDRKRAALAAHATQVTVAPEGRAFALSNDIAQPVQGVEHFVLIGAAPGTTEDDLFAGIGAVGGAGAGSAGTGA